MPNRAGGNQGAKGDAAGRTGGGGAPGSGPSPTRLAVSLTGELPCFQCGYELKGVSILGVCPECGTAVRATLLAVVDPLANELRPITRPTATAAGLLLWVGCFCLAAVVTLAEVVRQLLAAWQLESIPATPAWHGYTVCTLIVLAAMGAALLTRPHDHVAKRDTLLAWFGVLLHLPLAAMAFSLSELSPAGWHGGTSAIGSLSVVWEPSPTRAVDRLIAGAFGLGIVVSMRPVAKVLVARSLAIRTGRVDRQTMMATAAAIAVVFLGDALGLIAKANTGTMSEWLQLGAVTLLGFGSLLLGIGLLSSLVDSVRIARAIVRPGPSLHQVLEGEGGGGRQ